MSEPSIGAGDIEIELDGEIKYLKPSAEACMKLSRLHGGLFATRTKIAALDFDTICEVIACGLNANPAQRQRMVPELVYKTGLINLSGPCIDFTLIVGNGGRPIDEEEPVKVDPAPAS